MNFQTRRQPIGLFNILYFPLIVKEALMVLQQQATAHKKPMKLSLNYTLLALVNC